MTILLVFLALLFSLLCAYFQYFYKSAIASRITYLLASLRFVTVFALLFLLINPTVKRSVYEIEKTPLPIIVDNSSSITELKANQTALELFKKLNENTALKDKFAVQNFKFDNDVISSNTFDFKGKQTNIEQVAKHLKSTYKNKVYPTILISDGNQTVGNDYVFGFDSSNKVYPLILGDTTSFLDLKVSQINVNKYAFQKNKFPVEVMLQYSGNKKVNANFSVSKGKSIVAKQAVVLSPANRSATINVVLPAEQIGLQLYRASINSSEIEKNTYNNTKNFAVEVIDQRTNIALIATINHPDIGAIKRAIETNLQRKVTILSPSALKSFADYNVLILYQPTAEFKDIFERNKLAKLNNFIITGTHTDFNFLNQQQATFRFKMSNQKEDYLADYKSDFNLFSIDDIGFKDFPPLQNPYGTIELVGASNVFLQSKIRNISTNSPLFSFVENQNSRSAYLFGENIWKWRLISHVENKNYDKFDVFLDKTIQFLASNDSKKSLVVNHENYYNSGDAIEITAQYFNKNYEFDEQARLSIAVTNKNTKQTKSYDLLKATNVFKVNLDGLTAGQYTFSVRELNSNSVYSSFFEILDFNIEKQFVRPDVLKLEQLAAQTNGTAFMPNQVEILIEKLVKDEDYKPIQKAIVTVTPIIDLIWLLIVIAMALASEWFIRKYHGML